MKARTKHYAGFETKYLSSLFQRKTKNVVVSGSTLVSVTDAEEIEIDSNIINIAEGSSTSYAFQGSNDTLKKVSFQTGSQLETIGSYSFYLCTKLESIDLTYCTKLKEIHNWAFAYCYSLRSFLFPSTSSISFLGSNIFRNVPLETTFDLSNVATTSADPFVNTSLSFTCSSDNKIFSEYENNIYSKNLSILHLVSLSTKILKIHPDTTTISEDAFGSSSLQEVILPPQITTINKYAFHHNDYVEKIVLSQQMKIINTYAFSYLPKLEILYISEGIESIEALFIDSCPKIKIIHIPKSLKTVSPNSFNVPTLKHVTYEQSQYQILLSGGIPRSALLGFSRPICPTFRPCSGQFVTNNKNFYMV